MYHPHSWENLGSFSDHKALESSKDDNSLGLSRRRPNSSSILGSKITGELYILVPEPPVSLVCHALHCRTQQWTPGKHSQKTNPNAFSVNSNYQPILRLFLWLFNTSLKSHFIILEPSLFELPLSILESWSMNPSSLPYPAVIKQWQTQESSKSSIIIIIMNPSQVCFSSSQSSFLSSLNIVCHKCSLNLIFIQCFHANCKLFTFHIILTRNWHLINVCYMISWSMFICMMHEEGSSGSSQAHQFVYLCNVICNIYLINWV